MLNHVTRVRRVLVGALAGGLCGVVAAEAQEWSPAQQEVWEAVSATCQHWTDGDVEGLYEYVHPDLVWWNTDNDVPGDYATAKALDTAFLGNARGWLSRSCTPLTIQVFDTFAVVNAYGRGLREPTDGQDPQYETGRLHFVFKKEGTSWLQVANYLDFTQR